MLKVLHSADWHYCDKDHDEIEKCVDFMISRALDERPDLIVIAGDITDSQNLKLDSRSAKTICRQVSELADIAPVVTIIGTPSHDGRSAEILRWVKGKYQIWVSEKPEQIYLQGGGLVDYSGIDDEDYVHAVITQIPTPTKRFFQAESGIEEGDKAIAEAMTALFGAFGVTAKQFQCPHILNGHFQVGGAFISETQQLVGRDIEVSTDQIRMAQAQISCLGHIHKSQSFGDDIFYSGSIYRKSYGELEDKGFYIHEISEKEVYSRFIYTPTRRRYVLRDDFTKEDSNIDDWSKDILIPIDLADLEGALVKIEFKVWQDEAGKINQAELERQFLEAGAEKADISLIRIPRETVRAARVLQLGSLRDKVQEMAVVRLETVPDGVLEKADQLETMAPDELLQVVGRVN